MPPNPTNVLVTGGAGFIGSHLTRALLARGHRVRVLDDLSTGQVARLKEFEGRIDFVQGSILDAQARTRALREVEVVFHHAASVSVPQSIERPVEYQENNATGTLMLLLSARELGVRRIIYAASSSAYGEDPQQPKRESMRPEPISPYAASKHAGELYMKVFAASFGLQTLSLRYFNVFGPGQDPKSQYAAAIPAIVTRMIRGQSPTIYGDGQQTRDFCFIDNVVQANLLAAEAPAAEGQSLNIACGQRVSVNQIVTMTNAILGTSIQPAYAPPRAGDVRDSLADITAARQTIGYEPKVYFEEGLKRAIEWYRRS